MSGVVAANLRRTRALRGVSVRALSERLAAVGVDYPSSSLAKTEAADPDKRGRVDVDQLAALAVALDTSPAFLLAPADEDDIAVAPAVVSRGSEVTAWVRGDVDLWVNSDSPEQREQRVRLFVEAAPEPVQRRQRIGMHPLVVSMSVLETFVRDALDRAAAREHVEPALMAEALRQRVDQVSRYVELLADELEHDGRG